MIREEQLFEFFNSATFETGFGILVRFCSGYMVYFSSDPNHPCTMTHTHGCFSSCWGKYLAPAETLHAQPRARQVALH